MPSIFVPTVDASAERDKSIVPLCIPAWIVPQIISYLEILSETEYFEGTDEQKNDAMYDGEDALALAMASDGGCAAVPPVAGDEFCNEYAPDSFVVTYAPQDPFQQPDLIPGGYYAPPWVSYDNFLAQWAGVQDGDALCTIATLSPENLYEAISYLDLFDHFIQTLRLIDTGFPRFKVKMQGEGKVRLHLLSVPFGGQALISVDGTPREIVDLFTFTPASLAEFNDWLELVLGIAFTEDDLVQEVIMETEITGSGDHEIVVTLIPMIGLDGNIGFGGGLRKVVLCSETLVGVENQMPQFQVNQETFQIEWKPNPEASFQPVGQVIYPVNMRVEPDPITQAPTFQYTLQAIPLGGGADPFTQWRDLTQLLAGESPQFRQNNEGQTPFIEYKYPSDEDWTPLFDIPTGIDSVVVEMLPPTSPPVATLEDSILTLNLPAALDGNPPLMRVDNNMVQYARSNDELGNPEWLDLYPLSDLNFSAVLINPQPAGSVPFTSITENELTLHLPVAEIVKLRTNETHIQWAYARELPEDETWANLIDLDSLKGADGIDGTNGTNGIDGVNGLDGDKILHTIANTLAAGSSATAVYDGLSQTLYLGIPRGNTGLDGECECDPTMPYNVAATDEETKCNVAVGLTDWLFNQYLLVVQYTTGLSSDLDALNAMFQIIPQNDWNADSLFDLAGRLRVSIETNVITIMSPQARTDWQEWLYCNGAADGIVDPTIWASYIAERETILGTSLEATLYSDFLGALKFATIDNRAGLASYQSGDCQAFDCAPTEDFYFQWDFSDIVAPAPATSQVIYAGQEVDLGNGNSAWEQTDRRVKVVFAGATLLITRIVVRAATRVSNLASESHTLRMTYGRYQNTPAVVDGVLVGDTRILNQFGEVGEMIMDFDPPLEIYDNIEFRNNANFLSGTRWDFIGIEAIPQ